MTSLKTPLVLLFVLAIATAGIAYWSDNLGKKLGKKRVSLFGLRPRTTATLLTITSSWVIMGVTLAALLIAWQPLRRALFNYDNLVHETGRLQTRLGKVSGEIETKNKELGLSSQKFEAAQVKLISATDNERRARLAEAKARGEQRAAQERTLKALHLQSQATHNLSLVETKFRAARTRLESAEIKLRQTDDKLTKLKARLVDASKSVVNSYKQVVSSYKQMSVLKAQSANLLDKINSLQSYETTLQSDIGKMREQVARGQAEVEAANDIFKYVDKFYFNKLPQLVVGQVVAERSIPAHTPAIAIRKSLVELIQEGEEGMPAFRVVSGSNPSESVDQRAQLELKPLKDEKGVLLTSDQVLDLISQNVAASPDVVSVRLVLTANYFEAEPVAEVRYFTVVGKPAYRNGETIAADKLDGRGDDAALFRALMDLIEKGRAAAVERKVSPPLSPREPEYYAAPVTKQRLFEALRKLEALKRPAEVRLAADGDQTTIDPLRVRFEIE